MLSRPWERLRDVSLSPQRLLRGPQTVRTRVDLSRAPLIIAFVASPLLLKMSFDDRDLGLLGMCVFVAGMKEILQRHQSLYTCRNTLTSLLLWSFRSGCDRDKGRSWYGSSSPRGGQWRRQGRLHQRLHLQLRPSFAHRKVYSDLCQYSSETKGPLKGLDIKGNGT